MKYKFTNPYNNVVLKYDDDGLTRVSFLIDAEGSYQDEYRKWLEEGNTPEPADPEPQPTKPTLAELQAQLEAIQAQLKDLNG